jgi:hypothetical protein
MSYDDRRVHKPRTPTYRSWTMMIARCTNPRVGNYKYYGGRGIEVANRWRIFANFLDDMGERPSLAHSLDRWPNKNGNYEPENCRWSTRKEQARNTSSNRIVVISGMPMSLREAAERFAVVDYKCLHLRITRLGWTLDKAISTPSHQRRR